MKQSLSVIGVPFDLGSGGNGARYGPESLLKEGILKSLKSETGRHVSYMDICNTTLFPEIFTFDGDINSKEAKKICCDNTILINKLVSLVTDLSLTENHIPLILGGDHSVVVGHIGRQLLRNPKLGVVWIDGHMDAHTNKTSPSGHFYGMPVAQLLGYGSLHMRKINNFCMLLPEQLFHIGAKSYEKGEAALLKKLPVHLWTYERIRKEGWPALYADLKKFQKKCDKLSVSLDLDVFDPIYAPAVAHQESGWMNPTEGFKLAAFLANTKKISGLDIVEYNLKNEDHYLDGSGKTATLAINMACALLL